MHPVRRNELQKTTAVIPPDFLVIVSRPEHFTRSLCDFKSVCPKQKAFVPLLRIQKSVYRLPRFLPFFPPNRGEGGEDGLEQSFNVRVIESGTEMLDELYVGPDNLARALRRQSWVCPSENEVSGWRSSWGETSSPLRGSSIWR
jgi:hypothetical protein